MIKIHLRPVTVENVHECLNLDVSEEQRSMVTPNAMSLAEAKADPNLYPLAVYAAAALGHPKPDVPMIGFTMYEIADGVGFIVRLLIDQRHQGQGYGRATMVEVIRRLKLYPEVELIATSHRRSNAAAAALYRSLGFVEWSIFWALELENDIVLKLDSSD